MLLLVEMVSQHALFTEGVNSECDLNFQCVCGERLQNSHHYLSFQV